MNCKGGAELGEGASDYNVDFKAGSFSYSVFAKMLPFEKVVVKVTCKKGLADFDVKASVLDGEFSFRGKFDDRKEPLGYSGDLRISSVNFRKFANVYSPGYDTEGDITAHAAFTGKLGDWKTLKGKGEIVILNGNLYAIPILGPLTPLLGALLPTPIGGFNVAKDADATFTLADGFARTDDLVASTKVFHISSKGQVDYLEDRIQFYAQVKFGKLLGMVLFPVSKILEYTGEGTVGDPKWRPRFFSTGSEKVPFRKSDEPAAPAQVAMPEPEPEVTPKPIRPVSSSKTSIQRPPPSPPPSPPKSGFTPDRESSGAHREVSDGVVDATVQMCGVQGILFMSPTSQPQWYCVHTKPKCEHSGRGCVAAARGGGAVVPAAEVSAQHAARKGLVHRGALSQLSVCALRCGKIRASGQARTQCHPRRRVRRQGGPGAGAEHRGLESRDAGRRTARGHLRRPRG